MADHVSRLTILRYPEPALRERCQPIEAVDEEVQRVAERMLELMHEAPGVGLAAPQVGLNWRLFVCNHSGETGDDRVYINPRLSGHTREAEAWEEGCLSLPGIRAPVRRPLGVTIRALDLAGQEVVETDDDLRARIWQHETDHLDGVLILDRMLPADRRAHQKTLKEWEREYEAAQRPPSRDLGLGGGDLTEKRPTKGTTAKTSKVKRKPRSKR